MNTPTFLALIAIGLAIVVPAFFHIRKRMKGRVEIEFDGRTCDPEKPIAGNVAIQLASGGQTGPVRVTVRCSERLDGNGQPATAIRAEKTVVLTDGVALKDGQTHALEFSVPLPDDELTRGHTAHATHGSMLSMMRRDYDWWCIAEVETPDLSLIHI